VKHAAAHRNFTFQPERPDRGFLIRQPNAKRVVAPPEIALRVARQIFEPGPCGNDSLSRIQKGTPERSREISLAHFRRGVAWGPTHPDAGRRILCSDQPDMDGSHHLKGVRMGLRCRWPISTAR
jgi:hypothetical protein